MTEMTQTVEVSGAIAELRKQLDALPSSKRLSFQDTEVIYADAYGLATQGRFVDALKRFGLLILYRPSEAKYWAGLGLCNQQLGRYDEAISAFAFAADINPQDPEYMLSIAECEMLKHSVADALEALQVVIAFCREKGGCEKTQVRAEALLDLMTKGESPA